MKLLDLKEINEIKLKEYLEQNQEKKDSNIEREIEIHKRIKKLLEKYESLFFQISMDDAVKILSKLISKEEIKNVYAELISAENYKILREKNKKK